MQNKISCLAYFPPHAKQIPRCTYSDAPGLWPWHVTHCFISLESPCQGLDMHSTLSVHLSQPNSLIVFLARFWVTFEELLSKEKRLRGTTPGGNDLNQNQCQWKHYVLSAVKLAENAALGKPKMKNKLRFSTSKLHFSEKLLIFFMKITPEYQHFCNKIKDFSKKV